MNVITTEQLVEICCKAASNGYTKPSCGAARLEGDSENPIANAIEFAEAVARCPVGEYVHICRGAMGQDDYMRLDAYAEGMPLWETFPQQYPEGWAEEMLRHHG